MVDSELIITNSLVFNICTGNKLHGPVCMKKTCVEVNTVHNPSPDHHVSRIVKETSFLLFNKSVDFVILH